jgi:hypothetical protein
MFEGKLVLGLPRFAANKYPWETGRIPAAITPD